LCPRSSSGAGPVNAAGLWHDAGIGQGLVLLGLVWLIVKTADLAVEVCRIKRGTPDTDEQLVDEARELARLVEAQSHDLLQEAELLRAVVEEIRDDDRPGEADDELLVELRAIRGALEQLPAGGAR